MSTRYNGNYGSAYSVGGSSVKRQMRTYMIIDVSYTATKATVKVQYGVQVSGGSYNSYPGTLTASGAGYSDTKASHEWVFKGVTEKIVTTRTFTYDRPKAAESKTFKCSYTVPSGHHGAGTVSNSISISVDIMPSIAVSLNPNGGLVSPTSITRWASDGAITIPKPTYNLAHTFLYWVDDNGNLFTDSYTKVPTVIDGTDSLTAMWADNHPPTVTYSELYDTVMTDWTNHYSSICCDIKSVSVYEGRRIKSITLEIYSKASGQLEYTSLPITDIGTLKIEPSGHSFLGEYTPKIRVVDSAGIEIFYTLPNIEFKEPTFKVTTYFEALVPNISPKGYAEIKVEAYNNSTSSWDVIESDYKVSEIDGKWAITVSLGVQYMTGIVGRDTLSANVRVTYKHTDTTDKESTSAFFKTSRNANFGTGLANTVFISGCSEANYSSRVWWCYVNNPLYFPDTNYVEVGSNDTAVMGLCKVGDYLGAVKQSKTTDTAIFLLYPTSFDDDTTYAVRQGVQGVGALGKYTFNVLGNETLFLSPNGIMAIVPSEDNEHKVQNRSFFVDGQLLKEGNLSDAYSFVHDGKYYLALGDRCYVLDGNQKNSWGNNKTNLVYEAYCLENIPANCFMKYTNTDSKRDELWFSDSDNVYRFKDKTENDAYADESIEYYDDGTYEKVYSPVISEWSTIPDDDGSIHYFKTTEKKGTVLSILPTSAPSDISIYVKRDNDEELLLGNITVDGEMPIEFYANKKFKKYKRLQFIIRCSSGGFGIDSIVKLYSIGNYSKNRGGNI